MTPVQTEHYRTALAEPFCRYRGDWPTRAQTDTPDLLGLFREWTEEGAGYRAMNAENEAVYADLAEASFRTLPD